MKILRFSLESAVAVALRAAQEVGLPTQNPAVQTGVMNIMRRFAQNGIGLVIDESSPEFAQFYGQFGGQFQEVSRVGIGGAGGVPDQNGGGVGVGAGPGLDGIPGGVPAGAAGGGGLAPVFAPLGGGVGGGNGSAMPGQPLPPLRVPNNGGGIGPGATIPYSAPLPVSGAVPAVPAGQGGGIKRLPV